MNIAIVCYPTFGGSGVVATELGVALAHKGHQVHFITYGQPVRLSVFHKNIYFHQVYMEEYPLFRYQPYELALSSKMVEVVREYRIDVIHAHYAIPHAYAAYMAKQILLQEGISVAIITTLHGTDITLVGNHEYYKTAVTFSINASDAVTSVSESLRKNTYDLFDIHKDIKVIPNFIDIEQKKNAPKRCQRAMLANPDELIITHISNFRKVKRTPDVVEIFYQLLPHKKAKLIMVGDGPDREHTQALVHRLGLQNSVIFLGNSLEIDEVLCSSDLFLLPSESESFGLAALEAMAQGVPVISSNAGGIPEVNKQGYSGFLSPIGDIEAMVQNALVILKDEATLSRFKAQALQQASLFDERKIIPMYEQVYEQVVSRRKE
ncbi:N-acetyl-alpha-D-glucosaminyl L-malate synthase BshA [uncultured Capnocytophaga sp.]|jgi:N-acetyl-alpha-D-glucosaminyl L-malate synthase bshA|uniref:N-acetyl-alpha-D-glucosaminyl L-malate synthase BshA n=1 Tax=uncultured Capnocytophaga sp. TaxID=159273 RepID=UPI00261933FA|nr:N-acetyl-alpha-D-glucosaminyl L-malate synthase BshA [uncultured Capnocytophaga sp.]